MFIKTFKEKYEGILSKSIPFLPKCVLKQKYEQTFFEEGKFVFVNCIESWGGIASITEKRKASSSNYKVKFSDDSQPEFWAHNCEIDEKRGMSKIIFKDIQLEDIKPFGVLSDVFRFEARDNLRTDQTFFAIEIFTSDPKMAIKSIDRELSERNLFLVRVQVGVVVCVPSFMGKPNNIETDPVLKETYILFVDESPMVNYSDTPF